MKSLLLCLSLLGCIPARAQMMNNPQSGVYATCLARGAGGQYWAGSESEGLFRRDAGGNWAPFAGFAELGDMNVTCVRVDPERRVWVGTASAGLCVYARGVWTRFSSLDGPLAARVNALVVADDGSVWGATDAGVFHWSDGEGWTFPGVFEGDAATRELARRPVYSLAVDKTGRVLCATDDGLNRLTPGKGRASIEAVGRAPSPVQPASAQGAGFLPGPVHAVALDGAGHAWCATRWGVCIGDDDNAKWTFLRGRDWQDNARGSAIPLKLEDTKPGVDLLAEDWVTTLCPTPDGKMWLGFRSQGAEERDAKTREVLVSTQDDPKGQTAPVFEGGNWVSAVLPFAADQAILARFGGGLATLFGTDLPVSNTPEAPQSAAPAPQPATFEAAQLRGMAQQLDARAPLPVGSGAFYSLDRQTRGDWPLRYGNAGGELFATGQERWLSDGLTFNWSTAPHRAGQEDDFYSFTIWDQTDNPNSLQMPTLGTRRQSELNDGSWRHDRYPFPFDGPDLWTRFNVPDGLYRISFYWFNKDGWNGLNRMRDHRVQLFPAGVTSEQSFDHQPLAQARLWNGLNGEYVSFAVRGPALFRVRVARDRSQGTILSAFFFDRLGQMPSRPDWLPRNYVVPSVPAAAPDAPYRDACALWEACDRAESRGAPCPLERLVALRAAKTLGAPAELLRGWRVQAGVWDANSPDRQDVALPAKTG